MRGLRLFLAAIVLGAGEGACQLLFPTVVEQHPDADAPLYTAFDGSYWQSYSLGFSAPYFRGGAFDGRYVYLSPNGGSVERYDTHGSFESLSSWSTGPGKAGSGIFSGAAFDGRHVYFIGFRPEGGSTNDAIFSSFDTKGTFRDVSSWKSENRTKAEPKATSFSGAAFDGHYLYFAPYLNSYVERFDTTRALDDPSAWLGFDVAAVDPGAIGFEGAIFDGSYIYLIPHAVYSTTDAGLQTTPSSVLARYDTRSAFGSASSWEAAQLMNFNVNAAGFVGGAFDGRYVYLSPYSSVVGLVARYDTKGGLQKSSSWAFFEGTSVDPKASTFRGAAFDGRYVYFVPGLGSVSLRFDTTGTGFPNRGSWDSYDLSRVGSSAYEFLGALFDGQYVYFVPGYSAFATRFEVRTSPLMPKLPGFSGSFF